MDLGSRLLKDRIIMCSGQVNTAMAEVIKMELYYLEAEDPTADITMYINSPGGSVVDGMAIYDAMQYIKPDVCTIVNGLAASMGSLLLMAGAKGKRFALPNAEIMIHQPSGGSEGKASDMEISWEHMKRTKEKLHNLYVEHTGRSLEEIKAAMDRDNWLTPQEAVDFGLIDAIQYKR
jgi:ATP-dependent Clp protease protease subunit